MLGQRTLRLLAFAADEPDLDPKPVHLAQGDLDWIRLCAVQLLRHVLEHVLNRKLEVGRLLVLELVTDEVVDGEVSVGKADHRVDDTDSGG